LSFNHPQPHQPIQAGSGREAWMASGTGSASGRCYPRQSFPRNRGGNTVHAAGRASQMDQTLRPSLTGL